jgi:hypothetical protein
MADYDRNATGEQLLQSSYIVFAPSRRLSYASHHGKGREYENITIRQHSNKGAHSGDDLELDVTYRDWVLR